MLLLLYLCTHTKVSYRSPSVDTYIHSLDIIIVMQHSHVVDMKNDWKLMTILVGANDVYLGLANNIESRSDSNRLGFSNVLCSCSGDVPTIMAVNGRWFWEEYAGDFGRSTQEHSKALCQPSAPGKHIWGLRFKAAI